MERISNISNTSRSNNNSRGNQNYSNTRKTKGMPAIDSLKFKEVVDIALEAKKSAKDVNKFKSLIERTEEKLTSQLEVASLRENPYKRESTIMMVNNGLAAKARVERKPIEELSATTTRQKTISSYSTSYGQYKRDLSYVTPSYKSFEDTSRDSRGYKNNYSSNMKTKKGIGFNEIEDNTSLAKPAEKVSFWSKLKDKIKNFFKADEKKQETATIATAEPKIDKAAQYRKSVPKAAPQIDYDKVISNSKRTIRDLAAR